MSKWKVSSMFIGNDKVYQVYRTIDDSEPDHSGNREVRATMSNEHIAQMMADAMNGENGNAEV